MKFAIITCALLFASCSKPFKSEKEYLKEICTSDIHLEWFFNSSIDAVLPDYIVVGDVKNNVSDTIYKGYNIEDIYLKSDTIFILFNGSPHLYAATELPDTVYNYTICVDSSTYLKTTNPRSTYTKKETTPAE